MIVYEWAIEYIDEHDDVEDADHGDTFAEVLKLSRERTALVLIRNNWDDDDLTDRSWAYLEDGKLPEYFHNAIGNPTGHRVPQKFHKEIAAALTTQRGSGSI